MKTILTIIVMCVAVLALPFACTYYTTVYNKTAGTTLDISKSDRSREAFKQSKPYVENMVKSLAKLKLQYDLANDEDKEIIARNIKIEYANFDVNLIDNYQLQQFLLNIR